jgi:hypothetical protein
LRFRFGVICCGVFTRRKRERREEEQGERRALMQQPYYLSPSAVRLYYDHIV